MTTSNRLNEDGTFVGLDMGPLGYFIVGVGWTLFFELFLWLMIS